MAWLKRKAPPPADAGDLVHNPPVSGRHGWAGDANPYDFEVAHRRLAWQFRLSVASNVVLVLAITTLVNAFTYLLPLKETEIALVRTFEPDDRIYRIEPISSKVEGFELLLETMAKRYVRLLLEIDPVTQTERFREAFAMTDARFTERFRKERIDSRQVQDAISSSLVRTIHVESSQKLESYGPNHKFVVDFVQVDSRHGEEVQRKAVRAYLSMTTRLQSVRAADRFTNPLGVLVLDLSLKDRPGDAVVPATTRTLREAAR